MTLSALDAPLELPEPAVRLGQLNRLPGSSSDDPFLPLAAGWLVG